MRCVTKAPLLQRAEDRARQNRAEQSRATEELRRLFWPQNLVGALQQQAQASLKAAGRQKPAGSK